MKFSGNLIKMRSEYTNPVTYFLKLGDSELKMNELLGKLLLLKYTGIIHCIQCGKRTSKSYSQGYCYNCMLTAPQADESVVRPELSKAQFGIARDMEWSKENDLIDHFVYLSVTSGLKVGVTRSHQLFTRWIDQGAAQAIKLSCTPNRHIAGITEVFLKKYAADKTNWLKMLSGDTTHQINLIDEKARLLALLPSELQQYSERDNTIYPIFYPVQSIPDSLYQISLEQNAEISGRLVGIRGQYLIFDDGGVLNIRKYSGYFVDFSIMD